MTDGSTLSSAPAPALGYFYQCRVALLSALRRARAGEEFRLQLETLDDVVFEHEGEALALLQTKHHCERSANLTDASPDLWKTLRIWSEGLAAGEIPVDSSFYLITTSTASDGTAASYLRIEGRDPQKALERVLSTARNSTNKGNQVCYQAFLKLHDDQQLHMIRRIYVVDDAPNIVSLDVELQKEFRWLAKPGHLDAFLWRLEGWWQNRVIQLLFNPGVGAVLSQEFDSQMINLHERFKQIVLPIDPDIRKAQVDASAHQDDVFVRQLKLIEIGAPRVLIAIRDYCRASTQRSRWLRERLIFVGEIEDYEHRLVEEWERKFARMEDNLGKTAAEEVKRKAARKVYEQLEDFLIPILPNVTEGFVTRGSYQILSEQLKVGWHPEFRERLRHLLEVTS